jgi:DNA-binding beta-propeller fold protein YncE
MLSSRWFGFSLVGCVVAAAILSACSGPLTGSPGPGIAQSAWRLPATGRVPRIAASGCGKSVIYVTSYDNSVYIYDRKASTPCGQITGLVNPQGIFVDSYRNLWVAVAGDCKNQFSSVFEFAPNGSTPIKTLTDPTGPATDVAVDNKSGTVYVTNFFDYTKGCISGNNGVVEVYAGGSTYPTGTLSDPNMTYAFNDAVDNQGNLYVTYLQLNGPTGSGRIDEWLGGSGSANDLGITLEAPGGIQTTKNGALLVCDQAVACGDFAPGSTTMTNLFATQSPGAFGVALDKHEHNAWVENGSLSAGQLQRYHYPGPDKRAKESITVPNGGSAGVAVSPPAPQGAPH